MNSLKYGIIGKNWGYTIFKILRSMNKNCIFLNIKSPKKYKSQSEYKNICSKIIKDTSKNVDIVWIAVPSNEKFYLVNECIKNDLNIILEKPWLYSLVKSKKIIKNVVFFTLKTKQRCQNFPGGSPPRTPTASPGRHRILGAYWE